MTSKLSSSSKRSGGSGTKSISSKQLESLTTSSTLNFFKIEDGASRSLSCEEALSQSQAKISEIRSLLASGSANFKKLDIKDSFLCHAMKLRRLNRYSNFGNKLCRDRLAEARQKVEEHYLSLQNMTNEISHLRKNIDVCMEFQPTDSDIELVGITDFYVNAPEATSKPNITTVDPHELHLARLNYELNERKSMLANLQELEGRKSALLSDIRGKEQRLNQVRSKISAIKKATNPLLDMLGLKARHFELLAMKSKQKKASISVPVHLRPLYTNEEVYREIFGNQTIELSCDARIVVKEESMETNDSECADGMDSNAQQMNVEIRDTLPSANTTEFYKTEDALAESMNTDQIQSKAILCLNSIRTFIQTGDVHGASTLLTQAIALRSLNRRSNFQLMASRARLEEAKKPVERCTIELQNIILTVDYLRKSVEQCLDYQTSSDPDIELVPIEQFYAEVSILKPDVTRNNAHHLHMARLRHELRMRKSFLEKVHELEQKKKSVLQSIEETEKMLGRVNPRVEALKKTAKPLLDIVGLKSVALSVHNKEMPFRPVSVPIDTYREIFDDRERAMDVADDQAPMEEDADDDENGLMDLGEEIDGFL